MKLFIALAAFTVVAAPLQSTASSHHDHVYQTRKEALTLAKAGNRKAACLKYNEGTKYMQQHGLDQFQAVPTTGSIKLINLTHSLNAAIAKVNSQNSSVSLCAGTGISPVLNAGPTSYTRPSSSGGSLILSQCRAEWGTKYRMVKYCVDRQSEAKRSLGI